MGKNKYICKNSKYDFYKLQLERVELDIVKNKFLVGDNIFTLTALLAEPYSTVLVMFLKGEIHPIINNLQEVILTVSSPHHII